MRTITRHPNPPDCLNHQAVGQDWYDFMHTPCHTEVSESLHREQHYLCCYCELEIADGDSHIEHMEPRSSNPGRTYDYANLSASCNGGAVEHCGHFKDDHHKNPNFRYESTSFCPPHDSATSALFQYLINGGIAVSQALDSHDAKKAGYMIGYLGLECPRLTLRRREHARGIVNVLGKDPDDDLRDWAVIYYLQPDEQDRLRQFYSLSSAILNP